MIQLKKMYLNCKLQIDPIILAEFWRKIYQNITKDQEFPSSATILIAMI
jgi:hypothetical protein